MANKDKKKRDKKSDRKRRQRRERKGKLPSSVEALLGYLGGGGPTPAPQSDMKGKERAGYDAYDTLHSIIKSQQIQSAGYMANLEKIAFRTEIGEQLKKQGQENQQALEETRKEVGKAVENVVEKVGRKKRSEEEKIAERQSQIAWQMRKRDGGDPDVIARYRDDIKRYEGIMEFKQSIMPPASSVAPSERSAEVARAGGGSGGVRMNVTPATATSSLPSFDPNIFSYGAIAGQMGILSPSRLQRTAEVNQAMAGFGYSDDTSSSLLAKQVGITLARQQKQVAQKEAEVFGGGAALRSSGRNKK